ncbi:hypothetical protein THAOC_00873 [Thalassiosira oceanica]|uniref:Uncharacterized protein n=1 Tax=Thalassiosira oceanica TaxID=159749 RepID=K0TNN4_THAOC|nr:hypothetical protein THAOC_00873 [Thalassiosira oceanica]|eukprot:EJK77301.1 hypothetical protein THAOC_00873 [Thalassiosira oceanica]
MTVRTDLAIAASSDRKSKKEKPVVGPSHRNGQGRGPSMVTAATVCAPFASQSRSLTGSCKPDDLLANVSFSQPAGTTSRERQPVRRNDGDMTTTKTKKVTWAQIVARGLP